MNLLILNFYNISLRIDDFNIREDIALKAPFDFIINEFNQLDIDNLIIA